MLHPSHAPKNERLRPSALRRVFDQEKVERLRDRLARGEAWMNALIIARRILGEEN
jgi:anti-sigma28 factor (negative regulator of flagellin synthesis)